MVQAPSTTERLPPHDTDAEEAVIASLLVDDEAVAKLAAFLQPDDFFHERHALVYQACLDLWERNDPINQVSVAHELARRGRLETVGGGAFLSRIVGDLPTSIGVEYYGTIVQRDATYRRLIAASGQIGELAYRGGPDLEGTIARAETLIMALRTGESLRDFDHIRQLLDEFLEQNEQRDELDRPSLIRTGFVDLDSLLGGLKRSDLVILAARPSLGKTSFALNIARNAAVGQRARVAIFSLEMSGEQLAARLLSSEAAIPSQRLRLGEHTEREERRMLRAFGVLAETEIYVDDTAMMRLPELRAKARRLKAERGLDLLIVDYLQLLHGSGKGDNRVQEVSEISRGLKGIARELDVPVIAVSQLSRSVESRQTHIPMLSDLRESGSIEQDADVVMFIYREDRYVQRKEWEDQHPDASGAAYPQGIAQVIVAKHRNGPIGTVNLRFRNELAKFEDLLVREEDDEWSM
ncbi:MAG: replicative DNA helicase [Planctomycetes bacterium]|nr:replicative DNA helicase [Planctomycetota bacterium]